MLHRIGGISIGLYEEMDLPFDDLPWDHRFKILHPGSNLHNKENLDNWELYDHMDSLLTEDTSSEGCEEFQDALKTP